MRNYQKTNAQLKHVNSWFKAAEARRGDLIIEGIYFEKDTDGLVRMAEGYAFSSGRIRIGNRQQMSPCQLRVTWSYLGKCSDWKCHRLPDFDLDIKESTEERKAAMNEWRIAHHPSEQLHHEKN